MLHMLDVITASPAIASPDEPLEELDEELEDDELLEELEDELLEELDEDELLETPLEELPDDVEEDALELELLEELDDKTPDDELLEEELLEEELGLGAGGLDLLSEQAAKANTLPSTREQRKEFNNTEDR